MSNQWKRMICTLLAAAALMLPSFAARSEVSVTVNGRSLYEEELLLIDGSTYVPLEEFREVLGDSSRTQVNASGRTLAAGDRRLYMNGGEAIRENGELYIPVRSAAALYDARVAWDGETRTAEVTADRSTIRPGSSVYGDDELYWLSRIISAESRGEPLEGKLAVGTVVCNRVEAANFPSTVREVIFDRKYGVQFTPVANGTIYNDPTPESITAAKMCLEGYRTHSDILYFIYEAIASNLWTVYNRDYAFSIGVHDFYL